MSELAKEAKKKLQQVSLILPVASCKTFFQYKFEIEMIKTLSVSNKLVRENWPK